MPSGSPGGDGALAEFGHYRGEKMLKWVSRLLGGAGTAVSEVVVTGSRIPEPNLRSLSPIATVSGQTFKLQGHADVIDLLNTLPQSFQNNVTDFSNTCLLYTSPSPRD